LSSSQKDWNSVEFGPFRENAIRLPRVAVEYAIQVSRRNDHAKMIIAIPDTRSPKVYHVESDPSEKPRPPPKTATIPMIPADQIELDVASVFVG